ncbi:MAG TPA: hypothetical protein VKD72_30570 [Gemmataceae bacterium]|nr:hypothetical protein [Gemmataceae bacterium]
MALDPESRLVLCVLPGERTAAQAEQLIREVQRRTGGRPDLLLTSDAYPPYQEAVRHVYGLPTPAGDETAVGMPEGFCYATLSKQRAQAAQDLRVLEGGGGA